MHACIHRFIHTHIIVSNISIWLQWNIMDDNFNVCIYTYIHTYIYMYTYTYIQNNINMNKWWMKDPAHRLEFAGFELPLCPFFRRILIRFPRWKNAMDFLLFRWLKHAETCWNPWFPEGVSDGMSEDFADVPRGSLHFLRPGQAEWISSELDPDLWRGGSVLFPEMGWVASLVVVPIAGWFIYGKFLRRNGWCLVVWDRHFFTIQLGTQKSQLTVTHIFFRMGWRKTTKQKLFMIRDDSLKNWVWVLLILLHNAIEWLTEWLVVLHDNV